MDSLSLMNVCCTWRVCSRANWSHKGEQTIGQSQLRPRIILLCFKFVLVSDLLFSSIFHIEAHRQTLCGCSPGSAGPATNRLVLSCHRALHFYWLLMISFLLLSLRCILRLSCILQLSSL
jgi:hypothetical protein